MITEQKEKIDKLFKISILLDIIFLITGINLKNGYKYIL